MATVPQGLGLRPWWTRRPGLQLLCGVLAVLWASLIGLGWVTIERQSALAMAGMGQEAAGLARALALAGAAPVLHDARPMLEGQLLQAAQAPGVRSLLVLDAHGRPLAQVVREGAHPPRLRAAAPQARLPLPATPQPQQRTLSRADAVQAWHPIEAGTLVGWVRVDQGADHLQAMRDDVVRSTVLACLLAGLLGAALVAGWLGHTRRATEQAGAVADAHAQLDAMVALSPDGLVSLDHAARVRQANPAFEQLTGLAPADVIGQDVATLQALLLAQADPQSPPFDLARLLAQARLGPDSGADGPADAPRVLLQRPRTRELALAARCGPSAEARHLLHLRDVTRERAVERMKSEYLSLAAHELRTPMTSIHGCLELMRLRDFDAPRRATLLDIMHRQSLVMVDMINELLDLARIEARQDLDFQREALPLAALLEPMVREFTPLPGREAPRWSDGGASPVVQVDGRRIGQVLRNLLSNAYKYSQQGPVHVRLLPPSRRPLGLCAGFSVQDQGRGMTPQQLARVGERFFRADASGQVSGTGLGMSIVRELVDRMGGQLELASQLGRGTTVSVWLRCDEGVGGDLVATAAVTPSAAAGAEPVSDQLVDSASTT